MTTAVGATDDAGGWGPSLLRASGLVLLFLLPVQVVTTFLTTDVAQHSADALASRWQSASWRALDWAVLVLALLHGVIGVRRLLVAALRSRPGVADALSIVLAVAVGGLAVALTVVAFSWELA